MHAAMLAGALLSMIEMIHVLPEDFGGPGKPAMIGYLIEVMLDGIAPA
jgi:hypothetical protein